jgi:hypothetical protein
VQLGELTDIPLPITSRADAREMLREAGGLVDKVCVCV